ncbi:hypothetical protein EVAR_6290_1 [Eumeta japonica]|uniref:Uncharacterized protein n=1 Tax=Eumeta variegata TaxID=151549 RepID=A0A4C1T9C5_EUMVA|nr:hypothetical protein EVAR_6290_1 [Eumeta japonica]
MWVIHLNRLVCICRRALWRITRAAGESGQCRSVCVHCRACVSWQRAERILQELLNLLRANETRMSQQRFENVNIINELVLRKCGYASPKFDAKYDRGFVLLTVMF